MLVHYQMVCLNISYLVLKNDHLHGQEEKLNKNFPGILTELGACRSKISGPVVWYRKSALLSDIFTTMVVKRHFEMRKEFYCLPLKCETLVNVSGKLNT